MATARDNCLFQKNKLIAKKDSKQYVLKSFFIL